DPLRDDPTRAARAHLGLQLPVDRPRPADARPVLADRHPPCTRLRHPRRGVRRGPLPVAARPGRVGALDHRWAPGQHRPVLPVRRRRRPHEFRLRGHPQRNHPLWTALTLLAITRTIPPRLHVAGLL
ncbi:MAG: hypothetical protein AVDCRST_MAG66-3876, partial [uncultured Pseudonocardia sp.]